MLLHILLCLCEIEQAKKALFENLDTEKALSILKDIHTSESHLYQYFIKKTFLKQVEDAIPHLIVANTSRYYPYIYGYNSYFSKLFPCDFKILATLYLPKAIEINKMYISNKTAFKKRRLFSEFEKDKNLEESLEHAINLINSGDLKAEKTFLDILDGGKIKIHLYEPILRILAEKGRPKAMSLLGDLYYEGNGVDKCTDTAMHYYAEGANKKDANCYNGMGVIYRSQDDHKTAKLYFEEAFAGGNPDSGYNLYLHYKERYKMPDMGLSYLITSANKGYLPSIYEYSLLLLAKKEYRQAVIYLSAICDYSKDLTELLDKCEKLFFDKKYDECMIKLLFLSEMGNTNAIYNILFIISNFKAKLKLFTTDFLNTQEFELNTALADMGYKNNLVNIGDCYYYGIGVEQNYKSAVAFYLASELHKQPEGFYSMHYMLFYGLGIKRNLKKSILKISLMYRLDYRTYVLVWYLYIAIVFKLLLEILFKRYLVIGVMAAVSFLFYRFLTRLNFWKSKFKKQERKCENDFNEEKSENDLNEENNENDESLVKDVKDNNSVKDVKNNNFENKTSNEEFKNNKSKIIRKEEGINFTANKNIRDESSEEDWE